MEFVYAGAMQNPTCSKILGLRLAFLPQQIATFEFSSLYYTALTSNSYKCGWDK